MTIPAPAKHSTATARALMWPSLLAARELGGSATVREMNERAIVMAGLTEDQQAIPHGSEGRALENSARSGWTLTDHGRRLAEEETRAETRQWKSDLRKRRRARVLTGEAAEDDDAEAEEGSWKDLLIGRLLELPPAGFERLAQRLLREAGFVNVTVTGKSGDGAIDGAGTYRISLVSFPVYFQCKRYKGVVTPSISPRLPRCYGRPRREGPADHDRLLYP